MTTCEQTQHWLLAARADEPLPSTIGEHLAQCPKCSRLRIRLQRLDKQVRQLPLPPVSPEAKSRLLAKLQQTEQRQETLAPVRLQIPWRLLRRVAMAAAAILLFVGGWLVGRNSVVPPAKEQAKLPPAIVPDKPPEKAMSDKAPPGPEFVASNPPKGAKNQDILLRVVRHDVHLAETTQPEKQLGILSQLAEDLLAEAFQQIQQGTLHDVPQLTDLYGRVTTRGIVGRAAVIPQDRRAVVVTPLIDKIQKAEAKVEQLTQESLPVVADLLLPVRLAARDSAARLRAGRPPDKESAPSLPAESPSQLTRFVYDGLKLAEENDPEKHAVLCSELAPHVARTIVLFSANGETQQAADMGQYLGELVQNGIKKNLQQARLARGKGAALDTEKKAQQRVTGALSILQENLTHATDKTRAGLEQALEKSSPGWKKEAGKDKDKNEKPRPPRPPKKKGHAKGKRGKGKSFIPPGLRKQHPGKGKGRRHFRKGKFKNFFSKFQQSILQRREHEGLDNDQKLLSWRMFTYRRADTGAAGWRGGAGRQRQG